MTKVAIIGGGLVGTSVAHRLGELGVPVTLFDRGDDGQATAAGAGILPPLDHFIGIEAVLPLLSAARAHYPELVAALAQHDPSGVGYEVIGALQVALDERERAELPALAAACERRRDAGFGHVGAVTQLTAGQARSLFPLLGPGVLGAVHCSGAARIDGRRLLAALRARVVALGGEIRRASAVPWLEAGRVVGVRASEGVLAADAVVIAGGAWSSALLSPLGLQPSIVPQRGQLIHLELPGLSTSAWPIVLGFSHQYLLGFPGSRLVVGATREDGVGFDARTTVGGVQAVLEQAFRLAPALRDASLLEARVGFRPISGDRRPLIGALPRHANVFVAAGHAGYGLEVGPYTGALVAELIAGRAPALDLTPFAPGRFDTVAAAVASNA
jgi:glycine/D-amino acid oxidase-like deaminating enzyme